MGIEKHPAFPSREKKNEEGKFSLFKRYFSETTPRKDDDEGRSRRHSTSMATGRPRLYTHNNGKVEEWRKKRDFFPRTGRLKIFKCDSCRPRGIWQARAIDRRWKRDDDVRYKKKRKKRSWCSLLLLLLLLLLFLELMQVNDTWIHI